jgi:hypothetical protein
MAFRLLLIGIVAFPAPLLAAQPDVAGSRLIDAVTACQAVADPQQRLACFDASVAKLRSATEKRDVVVLDKEEVRKTKRSLFGFSLPDVPFFGDKDETEAEKKEFSQIETTIVKVGSSGYGKWIMVLPDGAAWQFSEVNNRVEPEPGDKIVIKKAALGSYMANIEGQTAVRVQRIR